MIKITSITTKNCALLVDRPAQLLLSTPQVVSSNPAISNYVLCRITERSNLAIQEHIHTTRALKQFFPKLVEITTALLLQPLLEKKKTASMYSNSGTSLTRPAPCTKCCAQRKRVALPIDRSAVICKRYFRHDTSKDVAPPR